MVCLCRICTLSSWSCISEKGNPSAIENRQSADPQDLRSGYLCQASVQPLEGPVEMKLDPARRAGDGLPPVLRPPPLHEGHPDGAHPGEGVDRLEPVVH